MKKFFVALAVMSVVSSASFAATATLDIYASEDWTLLALPQVPIDSSVENILPNDTWYSEGNVLGYNPTVGSYDTYPSSNFTNMLLGEGYWFFNYNPVDEITYDAVEDGIPATPGGQKTDMWISLPGAKETPNDNAGGWHMIGNPYAVSRNVSKIKFTDGSQLYTWSEAIDQGLVDASLLGYEDGTYQYVMFDDPSAAMEAGRGYWFYTFVDDLAMIIDGN